MHPFKDTHSCEVDRITRGNGRTTASVAFFGLLFLCRAKSFLQVSTLHVKVWDWNQECAGCGYQDIFSTFLKLLYLCNLLTDKSDYHHLPSIKSQAA